MNRTNQAMSVMPIILLAFFFAVVGVACLRSSSSGAGSAPSAGANAVEGSWVGTASTRPGSMTLTLKSDMTGTSTWTNPDGIERSFTYTIDGNNITWSQEANDPIDCGGANEILYLSATINGSTMMGSFTAPAVGTCPAGSGTFTATKQ